VEWTPRTQTPRVQSTLSHTKALKFRPAAIPCKKCAKKFFKLFSFRGWHFASYMLLYNHRRERKERNTKM